MTFPQYITTTTNAVKVVGYVNKEDVIRNPEEIDPEVPELTNEEKNELEKHFIFIDRKGYLADDGTIWIFCGEGKPKNANEYPYFWLDENGNKVFSEPTEIAKNAFTFERMKPYGLTEVLDNTKPGELLFDETEINDVNAASAFFIPTIKDKDDFLKKIVKATIIEKGIDISRLKGKTGEKYQLPNMKAALINETKMSVSYFICWMNLLGCNFTITVSDAGEDKTDPLKNMLVYQSYSDSISEVTETGELIDFKTGSYSDEEYMEEEAV